MTTELCVLRLHEDMWLWTHNVQGGSVVTSLVKYKERLHPLLVCLCVCVCVCVRESHPIRASVLCLSTENPATLNNGLNVYPFKGKKNDISLVFTIHES